MALISSLLTILFLATSVITASATLEACNARVPRRIVQQDYEGHYAETKHESLASCDQDLIERGCLECSDTSSLLDDYWFINATRVRRAAGALLLQPVFFKRLMSKIESSIDLGATVVRPEAVSATHFLFNYGQAKFTPANQPSMVIIAQTLSQFPKFGICSSEDDRPAVIALCGHHYVFKDMDIKLMADRIPCTWVFRFMANELDLNIPINSTNQLPPISLLKKDHLISHGFWRDGGLSHASVFRDVTVTLRSGDMNKKEVASVCVRDATEDLAQFTQPSNKLGMSTPCGLAPGVPAHTTGGVPRGRFPWQAVLLVQPTAYYDPETFVICTGQLISARWVLTQVSCFRKQKVIMPYITIYLGVIHSIESEPSYRGEQLHVFPTFSASHDIALVKMSTPATDVMPVCLPLLSPNINSDIYGVEATAIGWLATSYELKLSSLRASNELVLSHSLCAQKLGLYLPSHVLCSKRKFANAECLNSASLLHKADGRFILKGLPGAKTRCEQGVLQYTSVGHFLNWIANVTRIDIPTSYV